MSKLTRQERRREPYYEVYGGEIKSTYVIFHIYQEDKKIDVRPRVSLKEMCCLRSEPKKCQYGPKTFAPESDAQ